MNTNPGCANSRLARPGGRHPVEGRSRKDIARRSLVLEPWSEAEDNVGHTACVASMKSPIRRGGRVLHAAVCLVSLLVAVGGCSEVNRTRYLAENGNAISQYKLGSMYVDGEGMRQDIEEGVRWLTRSAEAGMVEAQLKLGSLYVEGDALPQNYRAGVEWLRRAADQGHSKALTDLAMLYYLGRGVPQNFPEAMRLFQAAAAQRNVIAQFRLAEIYSEGKGIPRDFVAAHVWANLAAAQGHREAIVLRDIVAAKITPEEIVEAQRQARQLIEATGLVSTARPADQEEATPLP